MASEEAAKDFSSMRVLIKTKYDQDVDENDAELESVSHQCSKPPSLIQFQSYFLNTHLDSNEDSIVETLRFD